MKPVSQQLILEAVIQDTTSGDISPSYVQSGSAKSATHVRAAGKDGVEFTDSDIPTEYALGMLLDVFAQLGRGDLDMTQRVELAKRARGYLDQLKGAGNGQVTQEDAGEFEALLQEASAQTEPSAMWKSRAKKLIIKRAQALGKIAVIPDNWQGGGAMTTETLQSFIVLTQEGTLTAEIVQEAAPANNGVMKLRVPFYVGGSIARAKGIEGKLHFGADKLDGIILEGNRRIAAGKQPITVYARHAHALAADKLPVGRVVGLERRGGVGYAIEEIAPTTDGRDVQTLARNKMLNAVSLRASAGSYTLEKVSINGEEAWDVDLTLDGIDFAPDGPAQPTYGVEVLAAEAVVQKIPDKRSVSLEPTVLTLEAVKRDRPDLVQAIERPFMDANAKLTQELETVKASLAQETEKRTKAEEKLAEADRVAYIAELAAKFPDPAKALGIIQETCKDEKTKEGIASKVMPLLLDALAQRPVETPKEPVKPSNPFAALFPGSGSGQTLGLEALNDNKEPKGESVTGLAVPA